MSFELRGRKIKTEEQNWRDNGRQILRRDLLRLRLASIRLSRHSPREEETAKN